MTDGDAATTQVTLDVPVIDEHGLVSNWDDNTRLWLHYNEREKVIAIAGNRAALTSLARHLLAVSQSASKPGYNLSWEAESGWFQTDEAGLHISLTE